MIWYEVPLMVAGIIGLALVPYVGAYMLARMISDKGKHQVKE